MKQSRKESTNSFARVKLDRKHIDQPAIQSTPVACTRNKFLACLKATARLIVLEIAVHLPIDLSDRKQVPFANASMKLVYKKLENV